MITQHDYRIWLIIVVLLLVISQLMSFFILLTGMVFWKEMVIRKTYMQIIMIMSLSEILGALFSYVAIPQQEGPWCTAQAFLWMFFRRATWLWTTMIPICLWMQIVARRPIRFRVCNAIVWSLNLLISLLPTMAGVRYGGGANGNYQCFLEDTQAGIDWYAYIMVIPGTICAFLGVSILLLLEYERRKKYSSTDLGNAIGALISKNLGYPICLFVSWGPFNVAFLAFDVIENEARTTPEGWVLLITFSLSSVFGVLIGVVFFLKSSEARQRWLRLWARFFTPADAVKHQSAGGSAGRGGEAGNQGEDAYTDSARARLAKQSDDITADFIDDAEWDERASNVSGGAFEGRESDGVNPMRYSDRSEDSGDRIVSGDIAISNLRLHRDRDDDDDDEIPPIVV